MQKFGNWNGREITEPMFITVDTTRIKSYVLVYNKSCNIFYY